MTTVCARLQQIRNRIAKAEQRYGRNPNSVALLAVSKGQRLEKLRAAIACEQRAFGENYVQEALEKINALDERMLKWHFIGPLQANKSRQVALHFSWVHSIDRLKIATRLNNQRPSDLPPLNVCLQINVSGEISKAGVGFEELIPLAEQVSVLPRLKLRGVMAVPQASSDHRLQRANFASVHHAFHTLNSQGFELDTLSMGMSNDMEAAIAEGATLVRIGTAIFGPRPQGVRATARNLGRSPCPP